MSATVDLEEFMAYQCIWPDHVYVLAEVVPQEGVKGWLIDRAVLHGVD